ncbi:MAG: hypothetical protein WCC90_06130 [Methylocella sp.]
MKVPIPLIIRNGLLALTRKFAEILVSSLATILVMALFPYAMKLTPPFARDDGRPSSIDGGPAREQTSEALADFMERVALSHVAALRAPPVAASHPANVAMSEPATSAAVPLPPQPSAAPRRDRPGSSKVHVAASVPKVLPPVQEPVATIEPTVASVPVKAEPLPPLQYGMRLVANLGDMISASETRVVESVASMGDGLTSLVKKL